MSRKSFRKEFPGFSRRERFGLIGLCIMILTLIIIRFMLPHWMKHDPVDVGAYESEINNFYQKSDSAGNMVADDVPETISGNTCFYFDPNTATDDDWKKLGLNQGQIRNIRNYQSKGGYFYQKKDLGKLYTISVTQFRELEPYIRIGKTRSATAGPVPEKSHEKAPGGIIPFELNLADSSSLVSIPGIGAVLASRIIRYRKMIGGFVHTSQLSEVYGLKQEVIDRARPYFVIDTALIEKIMINSASFKELVRHPYINEQQTKGILFYRKTQGSINNMDELVRNHILTTGEAHRIRSYISFGQ